MSKFMTLLKGTKSAASNDAIRRTATETMAHLLERNRKFEIFLGEKLVELERRSGPGSMLTGAPSSPDDGYLDYYEAAPSPEDLSAEEIAEESEADEPLVPARSFGFSVASEPAETPDLRTDDSGGEVMPETPVEEQAEPDASEEEAVSDWQSVFGLDEEADDLPIADVSDASLPDDDGEMGEFD